MSCHIPNKAMAAARLTLLLPVPDSHGYIVCHVVRVDHATSKHSHA
jgi:hypothetical protein